MPDRADSAAERREDLWPAVNTLLAGITPEHARIHGLGALEAFRRNLVGVVVPEALAMEARMAAVAMLSVRPLLERIRNCCDGPLVLMKGAELALRYPGSARGFNDIDLLTSEPQRVHDQLREAGFVEAGGEKLSESHHHLRPMRWPDLPLKVEIHGGPNWPSGLEAPPVASIIGSASASDLRVEGILAPEAAHHALLVAAHAWAHVPLWRLRDLIDVRALAPPSERAAIDRTARAWGLTRLWRTTDRVTDAVLGRGRMPLLVRPWAKHLLERRERTVLENHLRALLAAYWALPLTAAAATTADALAEDLLPAPEEGWSHRLWRIKTASRNANTPMSHHKLQRDKAATGSGNRRRRGDHAAGANDNLS
jgi:hypothetical protein